MGCYEWVACRERDGRQKKRENNRQVQREAQAEDVHQSALCLLCTAADTLQGKETGRNRLPIKNGRKKGGKEKCEKDTPALKAC